MAEEKRRFTIQRHYDVRGEPEPGRTLGKIVKTVYQEITVEVCVDWDAIALNMGLRAACAAGKKCRDGYVVAKAIGEPRFLREEINDWKD